MYFFVVKNPILRYIFMYKVVGKHRIQDSHYYPAPFYYTWKWNNSGLMNYKQYLKNRTILTHLLWKLDEFRKND